MKTQINANERTSKVGLFGLLFLVFILSICSMIAKAQLFSKASYEPNTRMKNAGFKIKTLAGVNENAKAEVMNGSISSPYSELKPAFAPNGNRLYFSRLNHPSNTFGEADQEDIWYSQFDTIASTWSEPIRMPGYLNNAGPNYIENVSMTGDTIILGNQYLKNGKMRDGVSYSVNINGDWSFPRTIVIKNDYNISEHANHYVCLKSGVIISAVQRAETVGDRDLYVSFWTGEYASEPLNMGPVINSSLEEASPFLSNDGETLYFASKGHNGYGGFDIFVSKRLDESWTNWSEPENLGKSVNGPRDEEFFNITHCGRYAIFTKQVSVHNLDLFKVTTTELFGKPAASDLRTNEKPRMTMGSL